MGVHDENRVLVIVSAWYHFLDYDAYNVKKHDAYNDVCR